LHVGQNRSIRRSCVLEVQDPLNRREIGKTDRLPFDAQKGFFEALFRDTPDTWV
jgi:hypothetical protein